MERLLNKSSWAINRSIDMAFSSQVHNRIGLVLNEYTV